MTLVGMIKERLGNVEVTRDMIRKNNVILDAVTIRQQGDAYGMVIYLDDFEGDLKNIADTIARIYKENLDGSNFLKNIDLTNYEAVKEKIKLRVTSDKQYANKYMNVKMADLYVIPYIGIENGLINLTRELLKSYKVSLREIFEQALENMKDVEILEMEQMLSFLMYGNEYVNLMDMSNDEISKIVVRGFVTVSNKEKHLGAAYILLPSVQEKLKALFPNGFYIIPSSIHETLVCDAKEITLTEAKSMVKEANETQVEPEDRLSNNVYKIENGVLELA